LIRLYVGYAALNKRCVPGLSLLLCETLGAWYLLLNGLLSCARYDKYASIVVYAWGSTSVECANSLMMMSVREKCILCFLCVDVEVRLAEIFLCDFRSQNSSTTAMDVGYVGMYLILRRSWHRVWIQSV
jgi:hypothetical protein